jgi:hypothetical protein
MSVGGRVAVAAAIPWMAQASARAYRAGAMVASESDT